MQVENIDYWQWESATRYYVIRLQKNLFGGWTLCKSWGGLFNRLGGVKYETFNSLEEALKEISTIANRRAKRNYFLTQPTAINNKRLILLRLVQSLNQRFGIGKVVIGAH